MTETKKRGCAPLDIPVLETERLILRGFRAADAPDLAAIHGDEQTMRYLGGVFDASLAEAYKSMMVYTGHWSLHGCGKWAVEEKASGRLVGRTGYMDPPYEWPGLELGWTFNRETWGKGYATESAVAARDWAFDVLGVEHVMSMIDPENAASQAVARKVGEQPWRPFVYRGHENMLWKITRTEWQALRQRGAASAPSSPDRG